MFNYKTYRLDNELSLPVGLKINLEGEVIYGSDKEELVLFKKIVAYIKSQASSENIVVDLTALEEWHSIALKELIPTLIDINKGHIESKRTPITIIGNLSGDVFWATQEKHKAEIENGTLPWLSSFEEYKSKNLKLSIQKEVLIVNPINK